MLTAHRSQAFCDVVERGDPQELLATMHPHLTPAAHRMLYSALQTFARVGFHAATTRQIAGEIGLSPAAMYIHFRTKEQLLYAISLTGHKGVLDYMSIATADSIEPIDKLRKAVRAFVVYTALYPTIARVAQNEMDALTTQHRAAITTLRRKTERFIRGIITQGQEQGEFDVPTPGGATLAILSLCIDIGRWYRSTKREDVKRICDLYEQLSLKMVAP